MKVDIWSDVRCPFCYIGKRKFEMALHTFPHKDQVEINWHSFELDPQLETMPGLNSMEYLAQVKGISVEQAGGMHRHVAQAASEAGLEFDFDHAVVANSHNAHRLIQMANLHGKGNEAEESLFKAHFVEGKNIDDSEILLQIATTVGLDEMETRKMLDSDAYSKEVRQDEMEAQTIGIHGVPFFILNQTYAVSGAQSPSVFLQALDQAWKEYEKENQPIIIADGDTCDAEGNCN